MGSINEELQKALESRHGKDLQKKISSTTVAICGLGGLGSNIAVALARAGVGRLLLYDFDQVDITNLHRQQYNLDQIGMKKATALKDNLLKFAPNIHIQSQSVKLDEQNMKILLQDADFICEAFDDAEAKAMLTNFVLENLSNAILGAASGMAGLGSANAIKTRKITDRFYICGDEISDVQSSIGLVSSRVMLCAAHQAHTVLRLIAGE